MKQMQDNSWQRRMLLGAAVVVSLIGAGGCQSTGSQGHVAAHPGEVTYFSDSAASRPNDTAAVQALSLQKTSDDSAAWKSISRVIGRSGVLIDNVYRVVAPRDDLEVSIDSMPVPTAAGIESSFRFYRCSCGKMNVLGEFVLADYEANDVMDVLRQHQFLVVSMGPLLLYDRPRLLAVRFQAEGKAEELAAALREALSWTGRERMASSTQPDSMPPDSMPPDSTQTDTTQPAATQPAATQPDVGQ